MSRPRLCQLRVIGPNRPDAIMAFGAGLTLITGHSDTGKSHILECIDYALGAGAAPNRIPEMNGYQQVLLELAVGETKHTISRRFADPRGDVLVFHGPLETWNPDQAEEYKAKADPRHPEKSLSGWLVGLSHFDPAWRVLTNESGKTQVLSFRTVAPFVLIDEEESIAQGSPVLPPSNSEATAYRAVFHMLLTGHAPDAKRLAAAKLAADTREEAKQRLKVFDELIRQLHAEIRDAGLDRGKLKAAIDDIDSELSEVSEQAARSGERVRGLLTRRNKALSDAEAARRSYQEASEVQERFELLRRHCESDLARLEFAFEAGHFFAQLAPARCPVCDRPLPTAEECHPDEDQFQRIRDAASAELRKLQPRLDDLQYAVEDAVQQAETSREQWRSQRSQAEQFDADLKQVASPTAAGARQRVKQLTARRSTLARDLLRFEQLDQYNQLRTKAEADSKATLDKFKTPLQAAALNKLSEQISSLLDAWKFPFHTDVHYSQEEDDLYVGGQPRRGHGAGVRAVTHAAFTVGLLRYCLAENTPHPGFVVIDTPLNNFKGVSDDQDDPELTRDVHTATLFDLARNPQGQIIVIENVEAPASILDLATVHRFSGPQGSGRQGFYPTKAA